MRLFYNTIIIALFLFMVICNTATAQTMELKFNFSEPILETVYGYTKVNVDGLVNVGNPGQPSLPVKTARIAIPYGLRAENIRTKSEYDMFNNVGIIKPESLPSTSKSGRMPFYMNTSTYFSNSFYPSKNFEVVSIEKWKGYSILLLNLYPVEYSPMKNQIKYTKNIVVFVDLQPGDWMVTTKPLGEQSDLLENPEILMTYPVNGLYPLSQVQGDSIPYVIITNSSFNQTFWELADWKMTRSLNPINATVVLVENITNDPDYWCGGTYGDGCEAGIYNDTQAIVRNFIKDAYQNWNTEFVLLGGDVGVIPHRGAYGTVPTVPATTDTDIPCDMYYGALDGNWNNDNDSNWGEKDVDGTDILTEINIGRVPVNTVQQAGWFVNKTIRYENATINNETYLKEAMFIGAQADAETEGANIKDLISDIVPQFEIEQHYNRDGTFNRTRILEVMNSTVNIINYVGHSTTSILIGNGGSNILSSDVDTLLNTDYYLFYSQGCHAGAFDGDAVAEHLVRGEGGALAFVGNSRYGWYLAGEMDGPSDLFDRYFFEAIADGTSRIGEILTESKTSMAGTIGTGVYRWVYFELNLLGDPETSLKINISEPTSDFSFAGSHLLEPPTYNGTIQFNGTSRSGNGYGSTFSNYTIEWGTGINPISWFDSGFNLSSSGLSQKTDSGLGTIDTNNIPAGTNTFLLTTSDNDGNTSTDRIIITTGVHSENNNVTDCRGFYAENSNYTLMNNVSSNGNCFTIGASKINLNCDGYTINYSTSEEGYGIFVNASEVNIENCNIIQGSNITNSHGIYVYSSLNTSINNANITTTSSNSSSLFLINSNNTNVTNSSLSSTNTTTGDIKLNQSTGLEIKRTTHSDVYLDDTESSITAYWLIDVLINNTLGENLSDANVTAVSSFGDTVFSVLTTSNGHTGNQSIPAYNITGVTGYYTKNNDTGKTFFANYTIDMELSEYNNISGSTNITDGFVYYLTTNNTDYGGPAVTITTPQNSSYRASSLWLNYTSSDITGVDSCWYDLDGAGNTSTVSCTNVNMTDLSEGQHNVTVYSNDTGNNITSAFVFFYVDLTYPVITITLPLNATYSNESTFNVNGNENLSWCGISLDGADNITLSNINNTHWNGSNFSMVGGQHNITAWCNDTAGNFNYSNVTFSSDVLPPTITFSISSSSVYVGETITYSCIAVDNYKGTFSGTVTGVSTSSLGTKTATCIATDDVGNRARATRSYTVIATSSGGGGGGSGATVGETTDKKTIVIDVIDRNTPKSILTKNMSTIDQIVITTKQKVLNAKFSIETLAEPPKDAVYLGAGEVYSYSQIKAYIDQEYIDKATITFSVNKSWILSNGLDENTIRLNRFFEEDWTPLKTSKIEERSDRITFTATTPGFSYFVVTGERPECDVEKKCEGDILMTCYQGKWNSEECEFGCNPVNPRCMTEPKRLGLCEENQTRCFGGWYEYCLDGAWEEAKFCKYGCTEEGCNEPPSNQNYFIVITVGIGIILLGYAKARGKI